METAKVINELRWNFVEEIKPKTVLDYGAGLNLLKDFKPKGTVVDTYDIGDFPIQYTGIRHSHYDLIFLCDVLEHIPDFLVLDSLFQMTDYVFVTVPILPFGKNLDGWKHLKYQTGEHLHYFTERSLDLFFQVRGFKLIKSGYPETESGIREDIYSALFRKKSVVFTNGVFDLLHSGHLHLLRKARKLGDKLIVGINSDDSAKRWKRKPIIGEKLRKELLEAISFVDRVEIFDEDSPLNLIENIKPDILVKGGDYTLKTVVGADFVRKSGGKVVIIPLLKGFSTTNLIRQIKNSSLKRRSFQFQKGG